MKPDLLLKPNAVLPFFTEGRWSLYHLLSHVLLYTGRATVYISSYSLSEAAIRSFKRDMDSGLIENLFVLLDIGVSHRKADLLLFAISIGAQVRLSPNHSKVVIVENAKHCVAVVTSQNLTPNPRLEAGCVFTNANVSQFYRDSFLKYYSLAMPFTYD